MRYEFGTCNAEQGVVCRNPLQHTTQPPLPNNNDGTRWEIGVFGWGKMAQILECVQENYVKGVNLSPN